MYDYRIHHIFKCVVPFYPDISSIGNGTVTGAIEELNTGIMNKWDILYNSTISEEINIPFMDYRLLKICVIDVVNNVVIASDVVNHTLLLAFANSNFGLRISHREPESIYAALTVKAKALHRYDAL